MECIISICRRDATDYCGICGRGYCSNHIKNHNCEYSPKSDSIQGRRPAGVG